ncbi:F-box protein CPR1-like [Salvia miltiorrhiza]|uniref:F-box protein CPR1-like n=1 Tax=Salvia miltiorrhiza TaxID=226208 RepID=UPI0025AD08F5|nr:F-box protein CPR1-like [Salvia miltiorrhiza]XP_057785105.1 F-box protein CPR1-like [Salvia miltiorrhiza]
MRKGFFTNLPLEITIDILSRLPPRAVISCRCVCKSWLELLDSHEFVKSHLSKSAPGMAVVRSGVESNSYEIFEFKDSLGLEPHHLRYSSVTKFVFPHAEVIRGSANGLLFLTGDQPCDLYVCNPITRHYIKLRPDLDSVYSLSQIVAYGFGVTKLTGQHKVVRIVYDYDLETEDSLRVTKSHCEVYTLGTRTWRSIIPGALLMYDTFGIFLNGNLHWLVVDPNAPSQISCLDLETELFSTFSHPPLLARGGFVGNLSALAGSLCLCDNSSEDKIVIWVMREYGVETSWTKEYVISKDPDLCGAYVLVFPIKVFEDGDILMECEDFLLFYYSDKTKTTKKIKMFEARGGNHSRIDAILHTPSFLSMKSFGMEDVNSF